MSIYNLLSPNSYNLYCNDITLHVLKMSTINTLIMNAVQINTLNENLTGGITANIINSTTCNCNELKTPTVNSTTISKPRFSGITNTNIITTEGDENNKSFIRDGYVTHPTIISTMSCNTAMRSKEINFQTYEQKNPVPVGGACIGDIPYMIWTKISSSLVLLRISPFTNNLGTNVSYVATASGVVPVGYRPNIGTHFPVNLIVSDIPTLGTMFIDTDGFMKWEYYVPGNNGWTEINVVYSTV